MTYTLIPGQSHDASEEETMSMIRSVLTEDVDVPKEKPARKAKAEMASPEMRSPDKPGVAPAPVREAFVTRTLSEAPRRRVTDEVPVQPASRPSSRDLRSSLLAPLTDSLQTLRAFRPSTRHLAIVSTALLIVVRPHWFVIGIVLCLAVIIAAFMVLSADRIWGAVLARLDRIEAVDPARAQNLRTRLDRFAFRWDAVLDLFPDGMVDSLYMPDFQSAKDTEAAHIEAMGQRLDRMVQEG
ncbi:hypothetical protein [uncultured Tateyamaria sp.]|uniref:hypothetical protein n=1 Tax=uncultured Tateyamaria sp. TaxID=455651 RepID=UPI00260C6CB0|nr:hypothetical protein [uncultured Tateyamaria sp.]